MVLGCKPEWNREAITVFSRLPSLRRLQATPPLQTSLVAAYASHITTGPPLPRIFKPSYGPAAALATRALGSISHHTQSRLGPMGLQPP